jgi:hypothetical protein
MRSFFANPRTTMAVEIEAKMKLDASGMDALAHRLRDSGATLVGEYLEENTFYDTEDRTMLAADDFKNRLISVGDDPAPSTPEQYAENIKREEGKWAALVTKHGLKIE